MAAARAGDLEGAVAAGTRALAARRKSLPSLLLVAQELTAELRRRYPDASLARDFRDHVGTMARAALPGSRL